MEKKAELRAKIDELCHIARIEWDEDTKLAKQREAEIEALKQELEDG